MIIFAVAALHLGRADWSVTKGPEHGEIHCRFYGNGRSVTAGAHWEHLPAHGTLKVNFVADAQKCRVSRTLP